MSSVEKNHWDGLVVLMPNSGLPDMLFFSQLFGALADTAVVCQWLSLLFPSMLYHSPSPLPCYILLSSHHCLIS